MEKYDILVVGGSTTGSWFARRMAERGHKVLVIEKEKPDDVSRAYDIFHMSKKEMEKFGLEIPEEGSKEFSNITRIFKIDRSARNKSPEKSSFPHIKVDELRINNYGFHYVDCRPPKAPVAPGCMDYTNIMKLNKRQICGHELSLQYVR